MVALSRCFGSAALLALAAEGARISKARMSNKDVRTKFIGGVPVLNYHEAYAGEALAEESGDREGEWIVMMKPDQTDSQISKWCKMNPKKCKLQGHQGGVPFFQTRATEADLQEIVAGADLGAITFIEADILVSIPDSELKNEAEGPSVQANTWGLGRIGSDTRRSSGQNTFAYVLDTGVRTTHTEFGNGRAKPTLDTSAGYYQECRGDLSCAADRQGHGTHCAGTIAAGNYGVAPFANIRGVKCMNDQGQGSMANIIGAMDWIARNPERPAVVSMSLGGAGRSSSQENAVNNLVNTGLTVVVAAGNDNSDACNYSPAFVGSAITVGSTDQSDRRSGFSNYGTCVNIWAPGSGVVSLSHTSNSGLATKSGTSMACPHVAGAALLVLQNNPSFNNVKTWGPIINNAVRNQIQDVKSGSPNALLSVREM